jgi:hypothetical protein
MSKLSQSYKEIFEINNLVSTLESQLLRCKDNEKKKVMLDQKAVWKSRIETLKKQMFAHKLLKGK